MEDLFIALESLIGITIAIALYLIARAVLIPLYERLNNWLRHRKIAPEESERALEAYPLSKKRATKDSF